MKTLQFEALKVALKQDKTGYVLTLCMHPDDIPIELLRDFVGARYQVVMVRLDEHEKPVDYQAKSLNDQNNKDPQEYSTNVLRGENYVQLAGILCRETSFWEYLHEDCQIIKESESEAVDWLRDYLGVKSRTEINNNQEARAKLDLINKEYRAWKEKI